MIMLFVSLLQTNIASELQVKSNTASHSHSMSISFGSSVSIFHLGDKYIKPSFG